MGRKLACLAVICLIILSVLNFVGCNTASNGFAADNAFGQTIKEKLDNIANPRDSIVSLSSNPYDYIETPNGNEYYKFIVSQGERSLNYMLEKFAGNSDNGLKEYIMAIACSEILGENTDSKDWASGREWYNGYIKSNSTNP